MGGLLFVGGPIWTGHGRVVEAVAVAGGTIVAAGARGDALDALADTRFDVVDLDGRMLVPGLHDAHVHPVSGALERLRCDLSHLHGREAYLAAIHSYAAANPAQEWITGGGWSMPAFPGGLPHRDDLDAVVPDRPVFLPNRDHHSAWVNGAALERAGINDGTPDPASGRIERDADGHATGVLHEAAMDLVTPFVPADTAEDYDRALTEAQRYLFSLGITGWQDAIVGAYAGARDQFGTYLAADRAGRLRARVTGALWWERDRGAEQIPELVARRAEAAAAGGRFRATAVKIMQDGVAENFTAAMLEPYLGGHGRGTSNVDPVRLREHVAELDRAGFGVHFHAIGDRAVRECLDAVAAGGRTRRHHIAHLQVVHPDDVGRFAELGVTANIQALWATHHEQNDTLCVPFLGPERAAWQYPFGAIARAGGRLAAGSDWPVTTPDPWWAIHVAVHRTEPAGSAEASWPTAQVPMLPEQALTLDQALSAYTSGSAYVSGLDAVTGDLTAGKAADLVVLDRDPFAEGTALHEVRADLVFVDGEPVHERTA
ncbi:amidohydrolase [Dactylosporangium fulvum]|uniref:Amidohydrolase n=1 Tax=Dactylosporangium fulvum TaxID=53359 RepID=A0ABY5WBI4_9ACTN|nr:amidohydrolase [Dactylosporangium fulvum]UWP86384.1 amidohydrolase [Dactylosporangium fulvum]